MLGERSQSQKRNVVVPLVTDIQSGQMPRERKQKVVASLEKGEMGSYCLICAEFQFCKKKRIIQMAGDDVCTTM